MAKKLKTFNLEEELYNKFSSHCKSNGISMSKRIENFIQQEIQKISPSKTETKKEPTFSKYC